MKSFVISLMCVLYSTLSISQVNSLKNLKKFDTEDFQKKTIILKIKPEYAEKCLDNKIDISEVNTVLKKHGVKKLAKKYPDQKPYSKYRVYKSEQEVVSAKINLGLIYSFEFTSGANNSDVIFDLANLKYFEYVEAADIAKTFLSVNDPESQSPAKAGAYYFGLIKAYQAWDITLGDTNIVIGIVDTGVEMDHPDLIGNIKYNYNDPIDGIDNDGDGYVDNFNGWDLVDNDNDPKDEYNHGVAVAGLACATPNNSKGIAGIGYKTKFLPIKVSDASGSITKGYDGIKYAVDHGCKIINCSWGSTSNLKAGQDMIDYAVSKGCLIIASAGNDGNTGVYYPASYNNVISVAASNKSDVKWTNSNYNSMVDLSAPGSQVRSTDINKSYKNRDGTSVAAPVVSGCAALAVAKYPNYTGLQIGELLKKTSDNIDSNNPIYVGMLGTGRINIYRALTEPLVSELTGTQTICVGSKTNFSSLTTGGIFSSSNFNVATVNSLTGEITGITAGKATISYTESTYGAITVKRDVTVNAVYNISQNVTAIDSIKINGTTYTNSQAIIDKFFSIKGCDSTITTNLTIKLPTSVGEINYSESKIKLYPNPFSNELNLEYTLDEVSYVTIQLFTVLGQKVFENQYKVQEIGNHKTSLNDVVNLTGVYNLVFTVNNKRFATRVVKLD